MALNSTDVGNQVITYDYELPAETEVINKQVYKIVRPGVYDGFDLSIEQGDPAQVRVSTGICYVEAANAELGVRMETTTDVIRTDVTPSFPYVVIHFEWYNDPDSFAEIKAMDSATIVDKDIVLGKALFSGSTLTGFDLDDVTHPREYVSNYADTIPLGETATIESTPTGGTTTNLNGQSTDVVEAIQAAFNRLIDLSGVQNDAVKNRHVDFGEGATQLNGGDFPLASAITTGGTASDIASSTYITAAIQTLASILANLSGADTNSVKERHIDFGTGSTQIDADLLPLGTAITQTISEATDVSFANSKLVRSAIADTLSRLSEVSTQVTTNKNNISSNNTDASDLQNQINKNSNIPVGVIWMYDGAGWIDDVTLPGWYACIPSNSDKGAPDLVDNFIKGAETGTKGVQYGVKSGNANINLSSSQLPPHTHLMTHGHTTKNGQNITGNKEIPHTHSMTHDHAYTRQSGSDKADEKGYGSSVRLANDTYITARTGSSPANTGSNSIQHNHAVIIDNFNGYTEDGDFANSPVPINPQHYKVIYIRKCFQR